MKLEALKRLIRKLPLSDVEELRQTLSTILADAEVEKEQKNQAKLKKFEDAVRKAGFVNSLKALKCTKSVKVSVRLDWYTDGNVVTPRDVPVNIYLQDEEATLIRGFRAEIKALQANVFTTFKEVAKLAKEYGVDKLPWEDAVGFLWEES